jgi:hypothetical protein
LAEFWAIFKGRTQFKYSVVFVRTGLETHPTKCDDAESGEPYPTLAESNDPPESRLVQIGESP